MNHIIPEQTIPETASTEDCYPVITAVNDALYAIGGKWRLTIITALFDGDKRFNQLQRAVTGISARVLSHELKELELNGFVKRIADIDSEAGTEYTLTQYSLTLQEIIMALGKWGKKHRDKIRKEWKQ